MSCLGPKTGTQITLEMLYLDKCIWNSLNDRESKPNFY